MNSDNIQEMEQNHFHPSKASDELVLNALFNPETPLDTPTPSGTSEEETVTTVDSPEVVKAKAFELEAVTAAEQGELDRSLQLINLSIDLTPDSSSLYNNRAQIYRIMGRTQDAVSDLDTAIDLSGGVGKSAVMAYTQRGLLLKLQGDDDKAWSDFKKAAHLGGVFAKSILVQTNPMAALCNRMLKEAVGNLYPDRI